MGKFSKRVKEIKSYVDKSKLYNLEEAVELVKNLQRLNLRNL